LEFIDILWNWYFAKEFNEILRQHKNGESITIGNFEISPEGITKKPDVFNSSIFIAFGDMKLIKRYDHLSINSTANRKVHFKINYLKDWNWAFIGKLLHAILAEAIENN